MNNDLIVYMNGKFANQAEARLSVFDQGVLYGDGVFEGIRVYNGRIFKGREHIDRIFDSAKAIYLEPPLSKGEVIEVMRETCRRNRIMDGYIRLVITRGEGNLSLLPADIQPTIFCIATSLQLYPKEVYEKGMAIVTSSLRRNKATILDPQIKSLNYLNNILAVIEARRLGFFEALMLTHDGLVAECAGDNVFIVKDGALSTPPVHVGILDGITRRTVIKLARAEGYEVQEKEFTLFNVYSADECFLTGTAAEIVPIREVDGRVIGNGPAGPITKELLRVFQAHVQGQGIPIYEEVCHEKR